MPVLYAQLPGRRARQVAADLVLLVAVAGAVGAGRLVESTLAAPAQGLRDSTAGLDEVREGLTETADRVDDLPVLGDRLVGPVDGLSDAAGQITDTVRSASDALLDLAHRCGLAVTWTVVVVALLVWAPPRLRFVVRATRVRSLLGHPAAEDLLARRALATAPLHRVLALGVGGGPDGIPDPAATRALAALALRPTGLRLPLPRPGTGSRRGAARPADDATAPPHPGRAPVRVSGRRPPA